ncbi:MAG TPA: MBL fold metallo-hydrolase [Myxococcota bacterium]|jgi:beta-lactamase superfamily II metal-dependent hydrolase|nr:MBL fold metallo-hydrolase [Myxococcota bacterium]
MAIDHVSVPSTDLFTAPGVGKRILSLLWGDRVQTQGATGAHMKVQARGKTGFVKKADLGGESLLELYFIDVGQGDGVLIRTPDHRHVLVDGGFKRRSQPGGKNAADFVDWKFVKDYGQSTIALDAVIASHNDADHFGGLWDLTSSDPDARRELDATAIEVEAFYHAGLSWWKKQPSGRTLGAQVATPAGPMWVDLLEGRAEAQQAVAPGGSGKKLAGEWAKLFEAILSTKKASGAPTSIARLSHKLGHVPGFAPAAGKASIKVLAPFEHKHGGKPALRKFTGGDSKNTNGQSVLLRVDYGRARIILTGDLNRASQAGLLSDWTGALQELECDVAKACHHGSDDVSYRFLQAMRPAVTVISSGDNEGHDHPRPGIVAASATTGFLSIQNDAIVTPLVYSTEIARSVSLGVPIELAIPGNPAALKGTAFRDSKLSYEETKAGDLNPRTRSKKIGDTLVVAGLVYGLVNVRSDGDRILCATMNEKDYSWNIKELRSRF